MRKRRVLMLTHRLPYPPDRGDRIRSYHMIKFLADHVDLALACTSDEAVWLQHHQLLATMAERVAIYPINNRYSKLKGIGALLSGKAITPSMFFRQGLADQLMQWQEQKPFDSILTFCTGMLPYSRLLRNHPIHPFKGNHVLDLVDVDSAKWAAYAKSSWPPMRWVYGAEAKRLRKLESGRMDAVDAITVISEAETEAYRRTVGEHDRLVALGNGVALDYFEPQREEESQSLCFVGVLNYRPNADGITWFAKNVMPRLVDRVPDATLKIVGRHPTAKIHELTRYPGVEVVGSVPDVRKYIREAAVVVAPLLIARGVQNKVLEAMASERLVVCSEAAAEGIDAKDGEHFVVARDPKDWVAKIEQALSDADHRRRIARAAREQVEARYSWTARLEPLLGLLGPTEVEDTDVNDDAAAEAS